MSTVSVKVVTRIRPQNKIESSRGGKPCVTVQRDGTEVFLSTDDEGEYRFTFDRVFGPTSKQKDVFEYIGRPVIDSIFKGYNGTIFAYGQTSSGKTHTMSGPDGSIGEPEHRGVIPRCIAYIFEKFGEADEHIEFTVQTSFMEIYLERVKDLLNIEKSNLPIREEPGRGIYVDGVTEEYVTSPDECLQKIQEAGANRVVAATGMNAGSSRSHSVTIIKLTAMDTKTGTKKNGKLCLVDLAGSEMVRKTGAKGQQLKEAQMINKSLSALGNVINALTAGKTKHIPYRDSKLTRLLQESLGGNACTVMIICCSPSSYNAPETVSTLRFGNRAKSIKNVARVNQQRSVEELTKLLMRAEKAIDVQGKYIVQLETQLKKGGGGGGGGGGGNQQKEAQQQQAQQEGEGEQQDKTKDEEITRNKPKERKRSASFVTAANLELESQISDLNLQVSQLKSELEEEREETQNLTLIVEEKGRRLGDLEKELKTEVENSQAKIDLKVHHFHSEIQRLQNELDLEKDNSKSLSQMIEERDLKLKELEEQGRKYMQDSEDLITLKNEIKIMNEQNDSLRNKLESMTMKVAMAEAQMVGTESSNNKPSSSGGQAVSKVDNNDNTGGDKPLTADLQQLVDEGSLTMEEALEMHNGGASVENKNSSSSNSSNNNSVSNDNDSSTVIIGEITEQNMKLNVTIDALRNDLKNRCQKVIELELALDKERDKVKLLQSSSTETVAQQKQRRALQQRLEQLVMVHRQLLRKYATMELEREKARKADQLKANRIKQLEVNARQLAKNMLSQSERHEQDMRSMIKAKDYEINMLRNKLNQILSNSDGSNSPKNVKGGRIIGGKGGNISGGHTIRGKGHQTSNSPPTNKSGGNGGVSSPWATGVLNFFKIGQK